jgi:outer membrane lipoprotein SlyB
MRTELKKRIAAPVLGVSLLGLTACGTITGAALGGATGAGIGAATHHRVEKSAAIGAGVGGAAGALYDIYNYTRRSDPYRD